MSKRRGSCGKVLLISSCVLALSLGAAEPAKPLFPEARSSIGGLTVTATLPRAHYGPGEVVRVYLTFRNGGRAPVLIGDGLKPTAVVVSEGREMTFEQGPAEWLGQAPQRPEGREIGPGETATASFEMKPARKDLSQGIYPIRVYCVLSAPPTGALRGTLVSNEAEYTVKYRVLMVY